MTAAEKPDACLQARSSAHGSVQNSTASSAPSQPAVLVRTQTRPRRHRAPTGQPGQQSSCRPGVSRGRPTRVATTSCWSWCWASSAGLSPGSRRPCRGQGPQSGAQARLQRVAAAASPQCARAWSCPVCATSALSGAKRGQLVPARPGRRRTHDWSAGVLWKSWRRTGVSWRASGAAACSWQTARVSA